MDTKRQPGEGLALEFKLIFNYSVNLPPHKGWLIIMLIIWAKITLFISVRAMLPRLNEVSIT
jgi:hypothetical protein